MHKRLDRQDTASQAIGLLLPSLDQRQALMARLKERGILSVFHYVPLHLSPMGRRYGGRPGDCPITENVSDRLLRLPFYTGLTDAEQADVIAAVIGTAIRLAA